MYGLIILDALVSILDIAALAGLLFIINFYTGPAGHATFPFLPAYFADRDSLLLIAFFVLAFLIKNLFAYTVQRAQLRFFYAVAARLSEAQLQQYLDGDFAGYVSVDSSVHIRKISQQPIEFGQHVLSGVQQIFTQSFLILVTVTAIIFFNAKLFLFVLLLLLPPVLLVAVIIKRKTRMARTAVKKSSEMSLQHIKEALAGYVEANIYDKKPFLIKRFMHFQHQLNEQLAGLQVVHAVPARVMELFAVVGFFILLLVSKWTGNKGGIDVLTIGMFMAAAYKIMPGLVKILNSGGQVRAFSYTIQDLLPQDRTLTSKKIPGKAEPIQRIDFSNISFRYDHQNILSGFSYTFKAGDLVGVSAVSGKGKTTLVNLLLGFINPDAGSVSINGAPLAADELKLYWPSISYVQQESFFINDSILKNITLNENDRDPVKLSGVIKATGLNELLDRHPEGINKCISESGKEISGGQRQRIAIARALYKDAGLVILDEPFNELDRASEDSLLKHFREMARQDKIILLITHNKESLAFCDKIISLDEA